MRVLITLVLTISLVSTAMATRLFAQIALPPVQLPDASRTLPSLPNLGAEPVIAVGDTLAKVRLDRFGGVTVTDEKDPRRISGV